MNPVDEAFKELYLSKTLTNDAIPKFYFKKVYHTS